jgi:hypothetical protein
MKDVSCRSTRTGLSSRTGSTTATFSSSLMSRGSRLGLGTNNRRTVVTIPAMRITMIGHQIRGTTQGVFSWTA